MTGRCNSLTRECTVSRLCGLGYPGVGRSGVQVHQGLSVGGRLRGWRWWFLSASWVGGLLAYAAVVVGGCATLPDDRTLALARSEYDLAAGLVGEKNVPGAFEHLLKALELDPGLVEAWVLKGSLHLFRGELGMSEQALRRGLELAAANPRYGEPVVSDIQNTLGSVLIHDGRLDEAIALLRVSASSLLNRSPHLAWGNLGWAQYQKGDHKAALDSLGQAVRQQPRFCWGLFQLGRTHLALQQLPSADEALTLALEVDQPECARMQDAWRLRGEVRAQLEMREEAISDFERCIELAPRTEAGNSCRAYLDQAR